MVLSHTLLLPCTKVFIDYPDLSSVIVSYFYSSHINWELKPNYLDGNNPTSIDRRETVRSHVVFVQRNVSHVYTTQF